MSIKTKIIPLVLTGPSGSGRAAISFRLICDIPNKFDRLISHTSRAPRALEKNGFNFYFQTQEKLLQMNKNKEFVTFIKSPHDHYYGTSKKQLQRIIKANKIPILKVTLESYLKNIMNEVQCNALYIEVPNMGQLQRRLHFGPFSQEQVAQKMKKAAEQERQARKYFIEQNIIKNTNIEEALIKIKSRLFQLY